MNKFTRARGNAEKSLFTFQSRKESDGTDSIPSVGQLMGGFKGFFEGSGKVGV
jgi:hypothetical protein